LIYDKQNDKQQAIAELQTILSLLNPTTDKESMDNINKAIDNLKMVSL